MHKLAHALTGFILVSALVWAQKPSGSDAAALIEKSRQISLGYARSLPDFICTEVISRYKFGVAVVTGQFQAVTTSRTSAPDWFLVDKLTANLSYFQQHETHELKLLNGAPTKQTFDSIGFGVTSTGEFGGILRGIFNPASQTSFRWESWKNDRRHPVGVYAYDVDDSHSRYSVEGGKPGNLRQAVVGFHGTLEIDRNTGEVIHLDHIVDHIPSDLEISRTVTEVDYDFVEVNGNRYLLPVRSQTDTNGTTGSWKNESAFRDYRKFNVSSNLSFGAAIR